MKRSTTDRERLAAALPHWAIVTDTGAPEAPYVGVWRVGATVFLCTLAESDACGRMEQLAAIVSPLSGASSEALAVHAVRFDGDDAAARYMRDLRRLQRSSGQAVKQSAPTADIPI